MEEENLILNNNNVKMKYKTNQFKKSRIHAYQLKKNKMTLKKLYCNLAFKILKKSN